MGESGLFPPEPVLIVDDEWPALQAADVALKTAGITNTLLCADSRDVGAAAEGCGIEVVLLDLMMPHVSGVELLEKLATCCPDIPVIVLTGIGEIDIAVSCMQKGAFDYMVKPVARERLVSAVRRAIEVRELRRENESLRSHVLTSTLEKPEAFEEFDFVGDTMRAVFRYVESIAPSPEPVLVTGETGVGKEVMARCLHRLSCPDRPLVPVNVAGLDDNAFSDTLFGHRRGAFTGALDARPGLIERAADGVLFLDEIGDLSTTLQVKLLRLLQEREYFPLGSDVARRTNARMIVATNRDLDSLRLAGNFRQDLYYRLRHHHVHIPAMRQRREDIPVLLNAALTSACDKLNKKRPRLPDQLLVLLESYDFPGNVRELHGMVLDACTRHRSGPLSMQVFRDWIQMRGGDEVLSGGETVASGMPVAFGSRLPSLKAVQDLLVDEAMARAQGNQSIAAQMLGVTRQALNKRLRLRKA